MKCTSPFVGARGAFGCGQCLPCRMNRRRTWKHRILLEGMEHSDKCFVTLTYREVPDGGSLSPKHVQDWLKRFRKVIAPRSIRYFLVGEYGDVSGRPHYHVALFGWGSCSFGGGVRMGGDCRCQNCSVVRETWSYGNVLLGTLEAESAQYIAGYVLKKMTRKDDLRLNGRYPEFARMSLKPGIGANAMFDVASVLMRFSLDKKAVPLELMHGKQALPLGRYLRKKLAVYCGQSDEEIAKYGEEVLSRLWEELQRVRGFAFAADRSVKSVYAELNEPVERSLRARLSTQKRRSL